MILLYPHGDNDTRIRYFCQAKFLILGMENFNTYYR